MKVLYSTGGSTPQELIISSQVKHYGGRHDPWGTHAIGIDPTSSGVTAFSGKTYGVIGAVLKDGVNYFYFTDVGFLDINDYTNWMNGWSKVYLESGDGPYFGEGWNPRGRAQFTNKVTSADYWKWWNTH